MRRESESKRRVLNATCDFFFCLWTDVVRQGGSSTATQQGEKVSSSKENSSKEGVGGEHRRGHFRVTFYDSVAFLTD